MCNETVVDVSHQSSILSAIDALCAKRLLFTGYDVTRTARVMVGEFMARHHNLKSVIRRAFMENQLPDEYARTLVSVAGSMTFVYHPDTEDPYAYDPQALFPDVQDGDDPDSVQDNTLLDDTEVVYHTNSECRLSVPKWLLSKLQLSVGNTIYLQKDVNKKVLKLTTIPLTAGCEELTINKDGRVRISNTTLVDALGPTGLYNISINDSQLPIDMVISITKI